jgi:hypothetical protein
MWIDDLRRDFKGRGRARAGLDGRVAGLIAGLSRSLNVSIWVDRVGTGFAPSLGWIQSRLTSHAFWPPGWALPRNAVSRLGAHCVSRVTVPQCSARSSKRQAPKTRHNGACGGGHASEWPSTATGASFSCARERRRRHSQRTGRICCPYTSSMTCIHVWSLDGGQDILGALLSRPIRYRTVSVEAVHLRLPLIAHNPRAPDGGRLGSLETHT